MSFIDFMYHIICIVVSIIFSEPPFPEPICPRGCNSNEVCRMVELQAVCDCPVGMPNCQCPPPPEFRPFCVPSNATLHQFFSLWMGLICYVWIFIADKNAIKLSKSTNFSTYTLCTFSFQHCINKDVCLSKPLIEITVHVYLHTLEISNSLKWCISTWSGL